MGGEGAPAVARRDPGRGDERCHALGRGAAAPGAGGGGGCGTQGMRDGDRAEVRPQGDVGAREHLCRARG